MSAEMTLPELQALNYAFNGPLLAGTFVTLGLFGVALTMAWDYYNEFEHDPRWKKAFVLYSTLIGAAHTIMQSYTCWFKLIDQFGDGSLIYDAPPTGNGTTFTTVLGITPIQAFFSFMAFKAMQRNMYFGLAMCLILLLELGSGLALAVQLNFLGGSYGTLKITPNIYLWTNVAIDIINSTVLVYNFVKMGKGSSDATKGLLTRFVFMALRTALFTTAVALLERISHATGHGLIAQAPGAFLLLAFDICLFHTLLIRTELGTANGDGSGSRRGGRRGNAFQNSYNEPKEFGGRSDVAHEVRVDTIVLQDIEDGKSTHEGIPAKAALRFAPIASDRS